MAAGGRVTSAAFSHGSLEETGNAMYGGKPSVALTAPAHPARTAARGRWGSAAASPGPGVPVTLCHRSDVQGGLSQHLGLSRPPPKAEGAEPGSASHPRRNDGRWGENRVGFYFFPCIMSIFLSFLFFFFLSSRKGVSFPAFPPSACCGRRRQLPAAARLRGRVLTPRRVQEEEWEELARQTPIRFYGAAGDGFPTQLRGCGVGSGCRLSVCLSVRPDLQG